MPSQLKKKRNILLIEPGFQIYKEPILESIARTGMANLYIASGLEPKVPSRWAKKYAKEWISFDYNKGDLKKKISRLFSSKNSLNGILTYVEPSVCFTNNLQHELGLPVISLEKGKLLKNKAVAREHLSKTKIAQPVFYVLRNLGDIDKLLKKSLKFPLVVKPSEMMSSLGVRRVHSKEELVEAIHKARLADFWNENLRDLYTDIGNEVLVEELIEGPQYSIEAYAHLGHPTIIGVTGKIKDPTQENYFDEVGHVYPAEPFSKKVMKRIEVLTSDLHASLSLKNTFSHTEIKVRDEIPFLIESNCRLGGGFISSLIEKSTQESLGKTLIEIACGEKPSVEHKVTRQHGVYFVGTKQEGRILKFSSSLLKSKIQLHAEGGDILWRQSLNGRSRLGHVFFSEKLPDFIKSLSEKDIHVSEPLYTAHSDDLGELLIFSAQESDSAILQSIEEKAWPLKMRASRRSIQNRLQSPNTRSLFAYSCALAAPVGFLTSVLVNDFSLSLPRSWDQYDKLSKSKTKVPQQIKKDCHSCQYVVNVSSVPEAPKGTATILLRALATIANNEGTSFVAYGGRFSKFSTASKKGISIEDYVGLVESKDFAEPSIKMGLRMGARFMGPIKNYFKDPASKNYGALMIYDCI